MILKLDNLVKSIRETTSNNIVTLQTSPLYDPNKSMVMFIRKPISTRKISDNGRVEHEIIGVNANGRISYKIEQQYGTGRAKIINIHNNIIDD